MVDLSRQAFVVARFADYCAFSRPVPVALDPVVYLLEKLRELEEPMYLLKSELYERSWRHFLKRAEAGVGADEAKDFRIALEGYLSPGDCADAAFHLLDAACLKDPARRRLAEECFARLKVFRLCDDEDKPEEARSKLYRRHAAELTRRLGLDRLEEVRARRAMTPRRKAMILRRLRRETAEYAAVFHCPTSPEDTFTPFILPRMEALVAVNRSFLRRMRLR